MGRLQCVSLRFASYEDLPLLCQLHVHPWRDNIWAAAAAIHKAEQAILLDELRGLTCMDCGARSDFAADSLVSNFTHDSVCRCRQCEVSYTSEAFSSVEALQKWIQTNCPVLLLATLCARPAREIGDCAQLTLSTDALTSGNFLSRSTRIDRYELATRTSYDGLTVVPPCRPAHIRVHDDGMVAGVHFVEFVLPEGFRGAVGVVGSGARITGDGSDSVWTRTLGSGNLSRSPFWWKRPVNNPVCVDCGVRENEGENDLPLHIRVDSYYGIPHSGIPRCSQCHWAYNSDDFDSGLDDYRVCVDCGARESEGVRVESDSGIPRCYHCWSAYDDFDSNLDDYRVCVDCGARASEGVRVESDSGIPRCCYCWSAYDFDYRVCVDCGARESEGVRVESDSGIPRCSHCRSAYMPELRPPIDDSEEGGWETSTSSTGVMCEVHSETVGLLLDIERQTLSAYLDGSLTCVFAGHGGSLRDKSLHWAVHSCSEDPDDNRPVAVERKSAPCTVPEDHCSLETQCTILL